jgi:hypothetical protein
VSGGVANSLIIVWHHFIPAKTAIRDGSRMPDQVRHDNSIVRLLLIE